MAKFSLSDDGTMDTVVRCDSCGAELRFNYDGGMDDGTDDDQPEREQDAMEAYDAFVDDCIADAEAEHECSLDFDEGAEGENAASELGED